MDRKTALTLATVATAFAATTYPQDRVVWGFIGLAILIAWIAEVYFTTGKK